MSKKKEVAKVAKGELVAGAIDENMLLEDAEDGHGFTKDDLKLPFIKILQKLSPQLDKNESVYIKEAEEGDFMNSATDVTYSGEDGIYFVPVTYTMNYTEWTPRDSGGGLVADHGTDKSVLNDCERDKGKDVTPSGNLIVTSGMYFGFIVDLETGFYEQAVIAMSSTQLKKSRSLNSQLQNYRHTIKTKEGPKQISPRMWFHIFKVTTIPESNDNGKWMGFKLERDGSVLEYKWGHEIYAAGRDLADMFAKGELSVQAENLGAGEEDAKPAAPKRNEEAGIDDDIPF